MKKFKYVSLTILALIIWTAFVAYGFINGFLLKPITFQNTGEAFLEAAKERLSEVFVGNFAMTLIENGEKTTEFFYSKDQPIDETTSFPVASISKWVTSFGVMKLVEQGKLDLDKPIDDYLTRWHLPESDFDNQKVTPRKLLSHSSGLIDELGYDGFSSNKEVQTIEQSLTKALDGPETGGVAIVGYEPGSRYMYSGAGYTILQLLIEEISGKSFQDFMEEEIFKPLKMNNSTFILSEKPHIQLANIYKNDGSTRPMNKFTALAAASLFTSSEDLTKFLKANISPNPVLSSGTITKMSQAESFINSTGVYGLGPHLYSQNITNSTIIGHDGSGNNAINTSARIDLESKNGIIILETGNYSIASELADEWIFWKAGIADYVVMQRNKSFILTILIIGYLVILAVSIHLIRKNLNKQPAGIQ